MSESCAEKRPQYNVDLHREIRAAFKIPGVGEVSPGELSKVIRTTININDTLESVKEKMSVYDLEDQPWFSSSWDNYLNIWVCEIITEYGSGFFREQRGIALLFHFDESKRLTKFEVMRFRLRE